MNGLLAALAGGLMFLAFPPYSLWPLSFPAAGLLVFSLRRSHSAGEAAALAIIERIVFAGLVVSYFRGLGGWVHALIVLPLVWPWAGLGWAFHAIRRRVNEERALFLFPFLWVLCEWTSGELHFLRNHITSWGTVFAATPALLLAPAWGLYGVSFAAAALCVSPWIKSRQRMIHLAILALPVLAHWAIPRSADQPTSAGTGRVATVTLNASDGSEKEFDDPGRPWTAERRKEFLAHAERRLESVFKKASSLRPDLLLLPEDTLDVSLESDPDPKLLLEWNIENNGAALQAYRGLAAKLGSAVAVGLTTVRQKRNYNSVALIDHNGRLTALHDKLQLAAGSEYWPYSSWLPIARFFRGKQGFVEPDDQYVPAENPFAPLQLGLSRIGPLICLEGQIPSFYTRWKKAGVDFIILLSNAQWFGSDPRAYNRQVLHLTQVQAAAHALPVFISGKSGDLGFVDDRGRADVFSPGPGHGDDVRLHEFAVSRRRRTLVGLLGEFFVPVSALALAVLLLKSR